ncbi:site-specific integrase [Neiella sp. HB171785]|uniref:Site-specific integrase n=1 Tax=Neiella litorisoli TaxID=2771431 RepID=A0A8J6QHI3_9GAMM|nr:site-specific integrase [Neiella litorisoli]MBD1388557.1 site-specific integrase [Neiella litorisoli]
MPLMTSPWKHPQTGVYYFRRAVPADIKKAVGRSLIKKTLGTKDPEEAKRLIVPHIAESDELFRMARLRADQEVSHSITAKDAAIIASRWYERMKDEIDAKGGDVGFVSKIVHEDGSISFEESTDLLRIVGNDIHFASDAQLDLLGEQLGTFIDEQLQVETLSVSKGSDQYRWIAKEFFIFLHELEGLSKARMLNNWNYKSAPSIADSVLSVDKTRDKANAPRPVEGKGPLLSQVLASYLDAEKAKVGENLSRLKSLDSYEASFKRFVEIVGDIPVDGLTSHHVIQFRDTSLKLPKSKTQQIRSMPIERQITYAKTNELTLVSPSTVKNTLKHVSTIINFAVEADFISVNPVQRVKKPQAKKVVDASELERGYGAEELDKIFSHEQFRDASAHKRHGWASYWIPLICRYTGARLNEIGQLNTSDIQQEGSVYYFNIRRGKGQSVKADSSVRHVPIHRHLIELGLLDYAESIGEGPLFPQVPRSKQTGSTTSALSKWWANIVRGQGVDPKAPAHEFRHTIKTELRGLSVPDSVSDRITGHSAKGEGGRYGSVSLEFRQEVIDKITPVSVGRIFNRD